MIAVDTSVWIEFFRGNDSKIVSSLSDLILQSQVTLLYPVKIEILNGARKTERFRLQRILSSLPLIIPEKKDWKQCEFWALSSAEKGEKFGVVDLLIASMVHREKVSIWSLDRDFERMEKLKFVQCFKK
jgi:predicted nucleic acid-binding protein